MSEDAVVRSSEKTIQEHLRHYYSGLFGGQELFLSSFYEYYKQLQPSLHKEILTNNLDVSTLDYSLSRLPSCIHKAKRIILAQSIDQIKSLGLDISTWTIVGATARRRQNYYNHVTGTMVVMLNSDSDLDDFLNCLIAYKIESQKFSHISTSDFGLLINDEKYSVVGLTDQQWNRLKSIFGQNWQENLLRFNQYEDIIIQSFPRKSEIYHQNAISWIEKLSTSSLVLDFFTTPIYLVSSNLHSVVNIIGGYVNQRQDAIINHTEKNYPELYKQWLEIKMGVNALRVIDFLYYISSKFFRDLPDEVVNKLSYEELLGIRLLHISHQFSSDVQLLPVSAIAKSHYIDPNLHIADRQKLLNSTAMILNIDYPLGFGAYYMFTELQKLLTNFRGLYVIGKAAILTGQIGDVQIPSIVFDERTNNIFHVANVFNQYFPFPAFMSAILQNQKAISVYGTFLENKTQLKNYTDSKFNIIEMESGPYLTAIHQQQNKLPSAPQNTVAHIDNLPYDLGIINYASDNPLSVTLGDSVMSLKGVEPTYLAALTTVQRIIDLESA